MYIKILKVYIEHEICYEKYKHKIIDLCFENMAVKSITRSWSNNVWKQQNSDK